MAIPGPVYAPLSPRTPAEPAMPYGLRALAYLIQTACHPAALPDLDTAELALHASHAIVAAPDLAPVARERIHAVRQRLMRYIAESAPVAPVAPAGDAPGAPSGGARVPSLPAPVAPLAPTGAALRRPSADLPFEL